VSLLIPSRMNHSYFFYENTRVSDNITGMAPSMYLGTGSYSESTNENDQPQLSSSCLEFGCQVHPIVI
jgi:hypothetical protein